VRSGTADAAEVIAASHPDMSGGQVSWSHALDEPWSFGRAARQRWAQPRLRAARTQTYFSDLQRLEDDLGYLQN
jgi:hypothetical protein